MDISQWRTAIPKKRETDEVSLRVSRLCLQRSFRFYHREGTPRSIAAHVNLFFRGQMNNERIYTIQKCFSYVGWQKMFSLRDKQQRSLWLEEQILNPKWWDRKFSIPSTKTTNGPFPLLCPLSMLKLLGRTNKKHQGIHKPKSESIIKHKPDASFTWSFLTSNKRAFKERITLKIMSNHKLRHSDLFFYTIAYVMWKKTLVLKCLLLLKETKSLEKPGPGASWHRYPLNFNLDWHFSLIFR